VDWEAAGAIGEISGAVAVFLTLIYLAAQIRQNTKAVKASAVDAAVSHVSNIRQVLFSSDDLIEIYIRGNDDPSSLDEKAVVRYRLLIHAILHSLSNVQAQVELAGLSRSNWESQLPIVKRIVSVPGGRWFWINFKNEFEEDFRKVVDGLLDESS
jgi:hypothetical protein